jgi:hypothetical protein
VRLGFDILGGIYKYASMKEAACNVFFSDMSLTANYCLADIIFGNNSI